MIAEKFICTPGDDTLWEMKPAPFLRRESALIASNRGESLERFEHLNQRGQVHCVDLFEPGQCRVDQSPGLGIFILPVAAGDSSWIAWQIALTVASSIFASKTGHIAEMHQEGPIFACFAFGLNFAAPVG